MLPASSSSANRRVSVSFGSVLSLGINSEAVYFFHLHLLAFVPNAAKGTVSHGRLLESHSFYHVHIIALRSRDTFTTENHAFNLTVIARLDFYKN